MRTAKLKWRPAVAIGVLLVTVMGSGCATVPKPKMLVPVATYQRLDENLVARVGFNALAAHGIMIYGAVVDEKSGNCWMEVDPDRVDEAKRVLREARAGLSAEERAHSFTVIEP